MPQFQQGMYFIPDYAGQNGDRVTVANQQDLDSLIAAGINVQTPASNYTQNLYPSNSPVTSTNGIRNNQILNQNGANDLLNGVQDLGSVYNNQLSNLLNSTLYSQTTEGKTYMDELNNLRKSLGIFSAQDEQAISEAGRAAYGQFDPLIREAEQQKKYGLPKAVVGGGERGGFMNTQVSGAAALTQTEGGDFIGEGGELNRIRSVYDQNISTVKAQAQAAMLAAQATARQAIKTGKAQDYQLAKDSFDTFQKSFQEAINLAKEKTNAISDYLGKQRESVTFAQGQEDRLTKQASDQLSYYLETGGADYIDKNKTQITDLFTKAGFKDTDIETMIGVYKKKAEEAAAEKLPKPELKTLGNNLYSVIYDPKTKSYKTELLMSKPSGGTDSLDGDRQNIQSDISSIRGSDGYLDTAKYKQVRESVAVNSPKLLTWFDSTYSPKQVLNPRDPSARLYFK